MDTESTDMKKEDTRPNGETKEAISRLLQQLSSLVRDLMSMVGGLDSHVNERQRRIGKLVVLSLALAGGMALMQAFSVFWDTIHLGAWRHTGRDIQLDGRKDQAEILRRQAIILDRLDDLDKKLTTPRL